jgi:sporulation protein YabP
MEYGVAKRQEIRMLNRKSLDISGVKSVESFDNEEFLLVTECGYLAVRGHNLTMKNMSLEQGQVAIEGNVNSLVYLDGGSAGKSKGLFGKLFK